MNGERHDRGKAGRLDRLESEQRLLAPRERLGDHEVDSRLGRPADLLLEHPPHRGRGSRIAIGVKTLVLQTSPANSAPLSSATSLAIRSAWRFIASRSASRPIRRSFSRCA